MVVLSLRPDTIQHLCPTFERLTTLLPPTTLSLLGLPEPDLDGLLSEMLKCKLLPPPLRKLICLKSGGNPLYAMEIARIMHRAEACAAC